MKYKIIYNLGYGHFNVQMQEPMDINEHYLYRTKDKMAKKILGAKHPKRTFFIVSIEPAESDIEL